ncbi:LysR family transcriptional regulator [Lactobacillus isalae]|uniref:LysR family transcriptional regulator n=1 Tax=Lactobacillus isalae TaxID=2993455 RepID=UPI0024A9027E|nr:LysR family transcriptional regulator [Lactobacillus isalae]
MYTQELNTFITVAELGSFSAASRKLYISKSAITQQINLLEKKIDCVLFDRNSHGVYLTEAGKIFLIQARKIQNIFSETSQIMQNYKNTIIVGTGYLSTTNFLEDYWNKFSKNQFFELKFKEIKDYENIPSDVDLIEAIYASEPMPKQDFLFKKVSTSPLLIGVPPKNKLATKKIISMNDLKDQIILLIKKSIFNKTPEIETYLTKHCKNINIQNYAVYNRAAVNEALLSNQLILVPQSLSDLCKPFVLKEVDWNFNVDIGFFYRTSANKLTHNFINSIS